MPRRLLAVIALAAVAAAPGVVAGATADLGLQNADEIRVASDIPYAPFEFTKPGSDEVIGFDVDLVKAIAATLGVRKVTFQKQRFDTILLSIAQKKYDMAASSVTITPKRAKVVAFSKPYFKANQSIMVRNGDRVTSLSQLEGKTVGVQRGTTGAELAAKIKGVKLQQYEIIDDAFNALAQRRVDAVINDFAISAYAASRKPQLVVTAQVPTNESYGLVFSRDNTALRAAFDRGLATIKRNGTYAKIYKKWFGTAPPA